MAEKTDTENISKSWFCVLANPQQHGYDLEPLEIIEKLRDEWIEENPTRTGAWNYCISADGLHHVHMVLEDSKKMRFTAIKKTYAVGMHFEPTKGNKEQAEDYINKVGKYAEKGETILCAVRHGEIKGAQGARRDFDIIEDLLENGQNPQQIMDKSFSFRRYEKMIKDAYYQKRKKETPPKRELVVHWFVGESGTGKTFTYVELCKARGEDDVYLVNDYDSGGMDLYCGEPILFLDEFKGQIKYSILLSMLQGYKSQIHARHTNVISLWNEVYITSIYTPDEVYKKMVETSDRNVDVDKQLLRRITDITYCFKTDEEYQKYVIPMADFKGRYQLEQESKSAFKEKVWS